MKAMTRNQRDVIGALRVFQFHWLAATTEEAWQEGRHHYVDDRVSLPKSIKVAFHKENDAILNQENSPHVGKNPGGK